MVSAREDPTTIQRALDHGASGFIPKSATVAVISSAIDAVLGGGEWSPPASRPSDGVGPEEAEIARRMRDLTPQQFRVLAMLGEGLLNKQIAHALNVSEATIKAHMTAILRKLGAQNRTQAVLMVGQLAADPEAAPPPTDED
jgi:DNA-binding NarL/FixJ family response regulator